MPVGVAVPVVRVRRGPEGVPVCEGVKEGVTTGWIFGHVIFGCKKEGSAVRAA